VSHKAKECSHSLPALTEKGRRKWSAFMPVSMDNGAIVAMTVKAPDAKKIRESGE